jgi:hypothetical protein
MHGRLYLELTEMQRSTCLCNAFNHAGVNYDDICKMDVGWIV